jgi:hypothetical protein
MLRCVVAGRRELDVVNGSRVPRHAYRPAAARWLDLRCDWPCRRAELGRPGPRNVSCQHETFESFRKIRRSALPRARLWSRQPQPSPELGVARRPARLTGVADYWHERISKIRAFPDPLPMERELL